MQQQIIVLDKEELKEVLSQILEEHLSKFSLKHSQTGNDPPLLTREEAASMLDVSLVTLNQWVKDGRIPAPKRIGKRVFFVRQEFLDFLTKQIIKL